MPTGITYAASVIADRLQAFTRALDAGTGGGKINLMDGTRPNSGAAITAQVLLCTVRFVKPSAVLVTNGVLSLDVDETPQTCGNTGIVTWARITDGNGVFVADCDVGVTGSGKEIEISKVQLYEGGEVTITLGDLVEV